MAVSVGYDASIAPAGRPLRVGIDIGGVLSVKLPGPPDNATPWKSTDPTGAYPFCVLFTKLYRPEDLVIITRTNGGSWYTKGGQEAWVVRYCRSLGLSDMGVPKENIIICKNMWDKGPIARRHGISAMIDDHYDCLMSVHQSVPDCALLCYTNSNEEVEAATDNYAAGESFWSEVKWGDDWRDLARTLELDRFEFPGSSFDEIWDWLLAHGPPNKPHDVANLAIVDDMLAGPPLQQSVPSTVLAGKAPSGAKFLVAKSKPRAKPVQPNQPQFPPVPPNEPGVSSSSVQPNQPQTPEVQALIDAAVQAAVAEAVPRLVERAMQEQAEEPEWEPEWEQTESQSSSGPSRWSTADRWSVAAATSPWISKKRARAAAHADKQARIAAETAAGAPPPQVITPTVFCTGCVKGEPGKYCIFQNCSHCCPRQSGGQTCPQHS